VAGDRNLYRWVRLAGFVLMVGVLGVGVRAVACAVGLRSDWEGSRAKSSGSELCWVMLYGMCAQGGVVMNGGGAGVRRRLLRGVARLEQCGSSGDDCL